MISIEAAESLARAAHEHQFTRLGDPRYDHVMRVAAAVRDSGDDLTVVAAILHDAVEKGPLDWSDLEAAGATPELLDVLDRLTERPGEDEASYLARCAGHPVARLVKDADLQDKLNVIGNGVPSSELHERVRARTLHRLSVLDAFPLPHDA